MRRPVPGHPQGLGVPVPRRVPGRRQGQLLVHRSSGRDGGQHLRSRPGLSILSDFRLICFCFFYPTDGTRPQPRPFSLFTVFTQTFFKLAVVDVTRFANGFQDVVYF